MIKNSKIRILVLRQIIVVVAGVFLIFSCKNPYPGFSKSEEGIYRKLLMIGDRDKCCRFGDYVTANIAYLTMNDSVFFSGIRTFKVVEEDFQGSINKCFTLMCKQDSSQFIISALDFFEKTLNTVIPGYLTGNEKMKVAINLMDIRTPDEFEDEQTAFKQWVEDLGEYEKMILKKFIRKEKIEISPSEDGIYYIELQAGEGLVVSEGDTITTHYEGYFLNGTFFDSTRQRNEPLQFVYGQQWQVIPGIEKSLCKMRKGGKALVIIPSEQAFGVDGSVLGIVPPYTPVVFEIELINVKK